MNNSEFSISVDLSGVLDEAQAINRDIMPRLREAVGALAAKGAEVWADAVMKAPGIWAEEKKLYAQSIKWEYTGEFSAVIQTDYKVAEWIESGRPARDLKRMLNTSTKVRRTESGKRFLVIPIRHNTPGNSAHAPAMPTAVHDIAQNLAASRVTGQSQRPSGEVTALSPAFGMAPSSKQTPFLSNPGTKGTHMVPRHNYAWGDRIKGGQLPPELRRKYAGMVRMDTSAGGAKSSAYMTFRIMMEGQSGWVVPAKPGMWLAKGVADKLQPVADKVFGEAVRRDLGV